MRLLLLALFALFSTSPGFAQAPNYLNNPDMFSAGWARLAEKFEQGLDVAEIMIRPYSIEVLGRAAEGGPRLDRWRVNRSIVLRMTFHGVSGPRPERPSSPVANVETGFFKLASVPVGRLWPILDAARARARLDDPGGIGAVRIARIVTLLPTPAHGEVRWTIDIASARESATVTAAADGRIMGVDISGTNRGRNRNFLEQDEWPLADAEATFRTVIGARREVYEIDVSRSTIKMVAVAQASPTAVTAWLWDGGAFRRDFVDGPNIELIRSNGNLPFSLDEIDIAKIPAVLKAAREKEPSGHPRIMIAKANKERVAVGSPRVLWEIQMVDSRRQIPLFGEDFSERTMVKVTPAGEVVSVLLPKSLRPKVDYLGSDGMLAALRTFRSSYGGGAGVFELRFTGARAHLAMRSRGQGAATFEVELTETGLRETPARPAMMASQTSGFTLDDIARLDKAKLEAMLARARAEVPLPGAVVHGFRIWSGEPFWRPRQGLPYIDIRVGVPPRHDEGGYVVFRGDGTWVETVK